MSANLRQADRRPMDAAGARRPDVDEIPITIGTKQ
jgi:hypothetical protein